MFRNRINKKNYNKAECLEELVNKANFTTQQRVTHENILKIGEVILEKNEKEIDDLKQKCIKEALANARRQFEKEKEELVSTLKSEADNQKKKELEKQRMHYEEKAKKFVIKRNEEEFLKMEILRKECNKEQKKTLEEQFEKCENIKQKTIIMAEKALEEKLSQQYSLDKKHCIQIALKKQEDIHIAELEKIKIQMLKEFEEINKKKLKEAEDKFTKQLQILSTRCKNLKNQLYKEQSSKIFLEKEFDELQKDEKSLLDSSNGYFNSDYLMIFRNYRSKNNTNLIQNYLR